MHIMSAKTSSYSYGKVLLNDQHTSYICTDMRFSHHTTLSRKTAKVHVFGSIQAALTSLINLKPALKAQVKQKEPETHKKWSFTEKFHKLPVNLKKKTLLRICSCFHLAVVLHLFAHGWSDWSGKLHCRKCQLYPIPSHLFRLIEPEFYFFLAINHWNQSSMWKNSRFLIIGYQLLHLKAIYLFQEGIWLSVYIVESADKAVNIQENGPKSL